MSHHRKSPSTSRGKERDETGFLREFTKLPSRAGAKVIQQALVVYIALTDPATPRWAKLLLAAALIYLLNPCDAIPDAVPMLGFTDDATAMTLALSRVAAYVTPEIERRAARLIPSWAVGMVGTVGTGSADGTARPAPTQSKPNNTEKGT